MNKNEYITPRLRVVDVKSRYGLLQDIPVSNGTVIDEGDIGFSKDIDFDDDEGVRGGSDIWED